MQATGNKQVLNKLLPLAIAAAVFSAVATPRIVLGQEPAVSEEESSTVVYQADFFDQYQPFSVNDMLARIPGHKPRARWRRQPAWIGRRRKPSANQRPQGGRQGQRR